MRLQALLLMMLLLGGACATLDSSVMSPQCRDLYNACLNRCPQPTRVRGENLSGLSQTPIGGPNLAIDTASCTNQCNVDQRSCK